LRRFAIAVVCCGLRGFAGCLTEYLHADGAWPQQLHAAIVGEVPEADEQQAVIGLQSMTASEDQKSGEIVRLRDMTRVPARVTGTGLPSDSAFPYFRP
jgi:hypothetical protein